MFSKLKVKESISKVDFLSVANFIKSHNEINYIVTNHVIVSPSEMKKRGYKEFFVTKDGKIVGVALTCDKPYPKRVNLLLFFLDESSRSMRIGTLFMASLLSELANCYKGYSAFIFPLNNSWKKGTRLIKILPKFGFKRDDPYWYYVKLE